MEEKNKEKINKIIYILIVFSLCCGIIYFRDNYLSIIFMILSLLFVVLFNKFNKKYHYFIFLLLACIFVPNSEVKALNISSKITDKVFFDSCPYNWNCGTYYLNGKTFYFVSKDDFIKNITATDKINNQLIYFSNNEQFSFINYYWGSNTYKLYKYTDPITISDIYTFNNYNIMVETSIDDSQTNDFYYSSYELLENKYLYFYSIRMQTNTIQTPFHKTIQKTTKDFYSLILPQKDNLSNFSNIESLDNIHSTFDIYDVNNELIKRADIVLNQNVSSDITPKEDLDYDYIHMKYNELLKEQYNLDYSDFNYHIIYEDESSEYRYNVVYYTYNTDFVFTNNKSGSLPKSAGTLYGNKVYMLSFNNMSDLEKDLSVFYGEVPLKGSNRIRVLWADNPIYLYKWKSLLQNYYADTDVIIHQGNNLYSPFTSSIEIEASYYAILIPKKNYGFSTKIAMSTAYYYGWYYLKNDNYYLVPNSSSGAVVSLLEGSSGSSFLLDNGNTVSSHLMIEEITIPKSYIDEKYFYIIHNRDENKNLKFYYNDEDFEVLNFTSEINSLTSSTNGNTYINQGVSIKDNVNQEYGKVDIGADTGNSLFNFISDIPNFANDLLTSFTTFGQLVTMFFVSMPTFISNGIKLIIMIMFIMIIIKIIRGT